MDDGAGFSGRGFGCERNSGDSVFDDIERGFAGDVVGGGGDADFTGLKGMDDASGIDGGDFRIERGPGDRNVRARIAVGIARGGGEALGGTDGKRRAKRGDVNAGDVRFADGDVGVADFVANERANGDFAGLEERDDARLVGAGDVGGGGEPEFDGVGERVAGGVLGDGLESQLATDRSGGLRGSDQDDGDIGGFAGFLFGFHGLLGGGGEGESQRQKKDEERISGGAEVG